jgi:hypothetical protein
MQRAKWLMRWFWCFVVLWFATGIAQALVLHPEHEPNEGFSRPAGAVVGRWSNNASCVAISPNYVVTVRHANGGVGSRVYFQGIEYIVREVWNEPTDDGAAADLRICRIEKLNGSPANLNDYVELYTSRDEIGTPIVVSGYGKGRGSGIPDERNPVGYLWSGSANQMQRWGQNQIEDIATVQSGSYQSSVLVDYFDLPGISGSQTEFEAAAAEWDSGGGWFIYQDNQWKLAGLSSYVLTLNSSRFNPKDWNYAIRISSYADWIGTNVNEPECRQQPGGDIDGDCQITMSDLHALLESWLAQDCDVTNDYCHGADLAEPFGKIDFADYAVLAGHWLQCNLEPAWGCE